uniref:Uncharacterized protein TCIL3000_8_6880 n=1 Tax=Trypanosoma congolense (strain IL3000) TaxID=1068625 RepID=G0USU8_TRYCI|nr:unnamed protein product [Trypanosoma congolense IL3000]
MHLLPYFYSEYSLRMLGDVITVNKRVFSILQQKLHAVGFDAWDTINEADVYSGHPHCYALFMRSMLCGFPDVAAALLRKYPWFCIEGGDEALASSVFRILFQEYGYKPKISTLQFRAKKFAHLKANICLDMFDLLKQSIPRGGYGRGKINCKAGRNSSLPQYASRGTMDDVGKLLDLRLSNLENRRRTLNHTVRG